MTDASNPPPPRAVLPTRRVNKVVYILLTFFFGVIGVHRFLRGQIGLGILYILTAGLFGIGVLIDFIIALVKLSSYPTDDYEFSYIPNGQWALPSQH
ncbi:MAG: TM2 domain-containing protein [Pseudolysinimonas sp.]|uniref:TM2 domain-containing protein n=1 Tax=Pseudolysinimonas sp. TaxID=2680009 RepID=UPI00326489D8